jgi:YgiT-type zinc finger domain-containing protein
MANPVCPETEAPMHRDVRPMTFTYKGEKITFDMPGWYCMQPVGGEHPHRGRHEGVRPDVKQA